MMNTHADLQRWSTAWQSQSPTVAADELRASVRRETRRLQLALAAPVLVTLVGGGLSTWQAVKSASLADWIMVTGVWFFIALAWIVSLLLARGTWRPHADTTAAFIDVAVRRCESALATVPFALALYALQLLFVIAWKVRYSPDNLAGVLTSWPTIVLGWIGLPLFAVFMLRYRRRKRAELARLRELRAQLCAD
jgi:hypothetical protein